MILAQPERRLPSLILLPGPGLRVRDRRGGWAPAPYPEPPGCAKRVRLLTVSMARLWAVR